MFYVVEKSTLMCFSLNAWRSGTTSYILLRTLFVMYTLLSVYVLMTICILLQYIILLIHMMIITGYHNVIVIVFLIGYHIFCTLLPECYYEAIFWMFFHLIIIFRGFSPHRLFIFSNFSW